MLNIRMESGVDRGSSDVGGAEIWGPEVDSTRERFSTESRIEVTNKTRVGRGARCPPVLFRLEEWEGILFLGHLLFYKDLC